MLTSARRLGVAAAVTATGVVSGDVEIADGRIVAVGQAPAGARGLAAPGLIDLHVHGFAGIDFLADGVDGHRRAASALLASGVTAYQPAFVCAPIGALEAALAELAGATTDAAGPRRLGAHLEGPFLARGWLGAHDPAFRCDPDPAVLARLLAAGPVGEVTLAPELPGAMGLISDLAARQIVASVGHTDATAAQAHDAFAAGARSVTHLCNAMRPLHHREPGVVGAALTTDGVLVELIVDGHHLADDLVRLVWRAAADRVALVTDAVAAAGMPDGVFHLGSVDVTLKDGAVHTADGTLAGSALTMIAAVRNLHALGVPLHRAVGAATRVPAGLLGRDDVGVLRPGAAADVIVLDDRLEVTTTLVGGVGH